MSWHCWNVWSILFCSSLFAFLATKGFICFYCFPAIHVVAVCGRVFTLLFKSMLFFLQLVMEYCLGSASDLLEGKFYVVFDLLFASAPSECSGRLFSHRLLFCRWQRLAVCAAPFWSENACGCATQAKLRLSQEASATDSGASVHTYML